MAANEGTLREACAQDIFCQIICAVDYLHNWKGIVHQDLKLENVMVTRHNVIKFIDFGFAFHKRPGESLVCGSLWYEAPEVLKGLPYGGPIDVWSTGVILYAAVCGGFPFESPDKALTEEPKFPEGLSDDLVDLLRQMLKKDPRARIDVRGLRDHPWFRAGHFKIMMTQSAILIPELCTYPYGKGLDKGVMEALRTKNVNTTALSNRDNTPSMLYIILRRFQIEEKLESGAFFVLVVKKFRSLGTSHITNRVSVRAIAC
jgi:serine/threonine protein kinase